MRQGKEKSASALLPGWEAHIDAFAHAVTKAPRGAVVGKNDVRRHTVRPVPSDTRIWWEQLYYPTSFALRHHQG